MNPELNPSDLDIAAWFPILLYATAALVFACFVPDLIRVGRVLRDEIASLAAAVRAQRNALQHQFEGDDAGCFDGLDAASSVAPEWSIADTPRWIYAAEYQQECADRARWN